MRGRGAVAATLGARTGDTGGTLPSTLPSGTLPSTLPSELYVLWKYNYKLLANLFFKTVRDTLVEVLADPDWLGRTWVPCVFAMLARERCATSTGAWPKSCSPPLTA